MWVRLHTVCIKMSQRTQKEHAAFMHKPTAPITLITFFKPSQLTETDSDIFTPTTKTPKVL